MKLIYLPLMALIMASPLMAETLTSDVTLVTKDGLGAKIGTVSFTDTPSGAKISFDLKGLPTGLHGMHVHQNGTCMPGPAKDGTIIAAGAAGGHFDPAMTAMHMGPMGMGHMGDLPILTVAADGTAKGEAMAPHIAHVTALKGHAIMTVSYTHLTLPTIYSV